MTAEHPILSFLIESRHVRATRRVAFNFESGWASRHVAPLAADSTEKGASYMLQTRDEHKYRRTRRE